MQAAVYERLERDRLDARRAGLAAERKARERDLLTECEHATIRLTFAFMRLQRLVDIKYRPDQPRVPIGQPGGGRWAGGDAGDSRSTTDEGPKAHARERQRLAQYSMGVLVAELPYPGGRSCVYKFGFGRVVVPGPRNFPCAREPPSAAVTHGTLLNDN
jgi:hypothetical protein